MNPHGQCCGQAQSPIDIDEMEASLELYKPLTFINYSQVPSQMILSNNGHTREYVIYEWKNNATERSSRLSTSFPQLYKNYPALIVYKPIEIFSYHHALLSIYMIDFVVEEKR